MTENSEKCPTCGTWKMRFDPPLEFEVEELPDLTTADAVEAMEDMAGDLYRAEDRLAFVREMCDLADREQRQVTTEQVRAWTKYEGCGGAIALSEQEAETLAADLAAGRVKTRKARIIDAGREPAVMAIPDDELQPLLALAQMTATCDASEAIPGFSTVGPCVLRRHHPGPVHKAANGATWSQVLPFPYDEVRCGSCDEMEDDCTCTLDDEPEVCPTVCFPDCRDRCHVDHRPQGDRDHEPDDCPGYRPPRWPFWGPRPSWMGKPLPTMQETSQRVLNDLAERGIRLVVPGYDTPHAPTWPYGVPRGDWVTVFEGEL